MGFVKFLLSACWVWTVLPLLDIGTAASPAPDIWIRSPVGTPREQTLQTIRRAFTTSTVHKRDSKTILSNSTTFAKSFNGAILFEDEYDKDVGDGKGDVTESVQVTCTTCYVKGTASVNVTTDGGFNLTAAVDSISQAVGDEFKNITGAAIDEIANVTKAEVSDLLHGHFSLDALQFPTLPYDFNVDVQGIPECHLQFQFDDLELYMLLDTAVSEEGTYVLNLYTSDTSIGVAIGDALQLGVFFTVDLILDFEDEIDISTGIHLKLDDGATIDINMFDTNVSSIAVNGGSFEFLPVTMTNSTSTFTAILRLGVHAGIELSTEDLTVADVDVGHYSAGLEVGVFADLAELTSSFNDSGSSDDTLGGACDLTASETYVLALGADAGATIALGDHTWGPNPTTTLPLFYTTLEGACVSVKTTTPPTTSATATTASLGKRRGSSPSSATTTTLTTTVTYTAVQCPSGGRGAGGVCPVSQQTTSLATRTSTLVTVVPPGSSATFPATTGTAVSTVAFGKQARSIFSSSGSPVSYVPPPPPTSTAGAAQEVLVVAAVSLIWARAA